MANILIQELKKRVIEQRNSAHVNCLEEKKQAYNDVINIIESLTPTPEVGTVSPKSQLLQVASKLLRVQLSEHSDDWDFSKSTPKKDIKKVIKAISEHNNFQRELAIKIKDIYDLLTK